MSMWMSAPDQAKQAVAASTDLAKRVISDLCRELGIDRKQPDWRDRLAPFAPVLAAMIAAAAATAAELAEFPLPADVAGWEAREAARSKAAIDELEKLLW